jgi:16S rRNA (cytidine1402-2'-O)-methyltransferase
MQSNKRGTLYVVATPIGNLQDITLRAIEILKIVDRIVAEDTRHATLLLKHFSIHKPIFSLHEFNERERFNTVISYIEQGEKLALISDAGTPLISDPGFYLVREMRMRGLSVVAIPGPCAAIAALSIAGLPTDRFIFEGFLSRKPEACRHRLSLFLHEQRTMIFYEAPHRLFSVLQIMAEVFGQARNAVVVRELTKIHETILFKELQELITYFAAHPNELRGECIILVKGIEKASVSKEVIPEKVLNVLLEELPLKQATALASKITGEKKNILYEMALTKKNKHLS